MVLEVLNLKKRMEKLAFLDIGIGEGKGCFNVHAPSYGGAGSEGRRDDEGVFVLS